MFRKARRYWYNLTHPVIGEVWQLHRITDKHSVQEHNQPYEISPTRLEKLIIEYKQNGYEFISIKEVANRMQNKKNATGKFVAATLDDGYLDNFEVAYPIFKKYKIPFCIFICENMVLGIKQEDAIEHYQFLSYKQILELAKEPLCTLGCHTRNHVRLCDLSQEEQLAEIMHCKEWLEGVIGSTVEDFAFPYGDYSKETINILGSVGIRRAVASWGGRVRKNTKEKTLEIPRIFVNERKIER